MYILDIRNIKKFEYMFCFLNRLCFLTGNFKDSFQKYTILLFRLSDKWLMFFPYLPFFLNLPTLFILYENHQKKFIDLQ